MDSVRLGHRGFALTPLAVDEHVDVPSNRASLVEYPARNRRMLALEPAQDVADRCAVTGDFAPPAREFGEWCAQEQDRHAMILDVSIEMRAGFEDGAPSHLGPGKLAVGAS